MAEPLAGRRVAVTRPREHSGALVEGLELLGAEPVVVPLISVELLDADGRFGDLVASGAHDWIVFTSANAVRAVAAQLREARARTAAVGPVTAGALRELGVEPAFVPQRFAAGEIAAGLEPLQGTRVLLPQSEIAEPLLADELRSRGAEVDVVDAYRTRRPPPDRRGAGDAAGDGRDPPRERIGGAIARVGAPADRDGLVVCIGPSTAEAARGAGLRVDLVAEEATGLGMIQALVTHFGEIR